MFTEKNFDSYEQNSLMLTAKQIRKLHKEGLLEINNIRNLERTANFGDDIENINDIIAIRIIANTTDVYKCYEIMEKVKLMTDSEQAIDLIIGML